MEVVYGLIISVINIHNVKTSNSTLMKNVKKSQKNVQLMEFNVFQSHSVKILILMEDVM